MRERAAGSAARADRSGRKEPNGMSERRRSSNAASAAIEVGVVTSDKMNKTRRVEIPRLVKHAALRQVHPRRTICYVHDEKNESHIGDTVEIMETRPLSKIKNWRLVRVVTKAPAAAPSRRAKRRPAGSDAGAVTS